MNLANRASEHGRQMRGFFLFIMNIIELMSHQMLFLRKETKCTLICIPRGTRRENAFEIKLFQKSKKIYTRMNF